MGMLVGGGVQGELVERTGDGCERVGLRKGRRRVVKRSWAVAGVVVSVAFVALMIGYVVAQEAAPRPAAPAAPAAPAPAAPAAKPASGAAEVVIVWCSGSPDAPALPGVDAGAVDVVTQATAAAGNIKEVAEKLAKELEAKGHSTLVISVQDCKDPKPIMNAKALVLGSPDYLGMPPWQMVKFLDETYYRIFRSEAKLTGKAVAAYATTDRIQKTLADMMGRVGGKAVEGAVIGRRGSAEERDAAIKALAERIVAAL
jgi:flavodoxin